MVQSEQQDKKKKLFTLVSEDNTQKIVHRFILAARNPGTKNYTQRFNEPCTSHVISVEQLHISKRLTNVDQIYPMKTFLKTCYGKKSDFLLLFAKSDPVTDTAIRLKVIV